MLPHTNLLGLIVLSFELAALISPAFATPSIKFTKGTGWSHPSNNASHSPAHSSAHSNPHPTEAVPDLARLCPNAYKPEDAKNERKLKHSIARSKKQRTPGSETSPYTPLEINVVWHSIAMNDTTEGGFMSYHRMQKSVDVLNEHFAPANVQFKLNRVDRYGNQRWYTDVGVNNPEAFEMRAQTHVGDAQVLNIWTTGFTKVTYTGGYVSFFPWDLTQQTRKDDGIVMRHDFFIDSGHPLFNDGKYLTHEVGHWVGLYHTFEGGACSVYNDGVDDTPAQQAPTYNGDNSCTPRDTCPDTPGFDPITNFMDYSHPDCQSHFTDGQIDRMRTVLNVYRGFPV